MGFVLSKLKTCFVLALAGTFFVQAHQTTTFTSILPETDLPFRIRIEKDELELPAGIQSYVDAHYKGKFLFLAGRWNGVHGFGADPNNFPTNQQNTTVYVVDFTNKTVASRSLKDPGSGLTQYQMDILSVTAAPFHQVGNTLYVVGGYGIDTATGVFTTKNTLTAINIPGLIHWVTHPFRNETAAQYIHTITNSAFQITGGFLTKVENNPFLLVFGHDFEGTYFFGPYSQVYSQQVRRFHIKNNGKKLSVEILASKPEIPDPNFRRRDLNVVPVVRHNKKGEAVQSFVALSGVFTPPPEDGVWTVPVEITAQGEPTMADPSLSTTFKQGMNNYSSATVGLFSKKTGDMYTLLLGGETVEYFEQGILVQDNEVPFTNQITTVRIDRNGNYSQHIMSAEFPLIRSTMSNPGNPLLFGATADFFPLEDLPQYPNEVFELDKLLGPEPILLGYMVGGIQSTLLNTNIITDSSASPYIFKVILEKAAESLKKN